MSSVQRNAKIYGAVETETFITYTGFCKKIYDTEQQEIEVFIDDKKIDVVPANQKISNIEDTYEVFDTEGFCFTYKLPEKYIGEKHKLEFKTKDGEQLVHSPIITMDENDSKYNESCFLESLNEPIDEEKIKDTCCPNSIGFLATEENLEDEEFVGYIKELMNIYTEMKFSLIYFKSIEKNKIENIFKNYINKITLIIPNHLSELSNSVEFYIHNSELNKKQPAFTRIFEILIYKYPNIFSFQFFSNYKKKTIKEQNQLYNDHPIMKNPKFFGLEKSFEENNLFYTVYKDTFEKMKENPIDLNTNLGEFEHFTKLSYAIKNKNFKEFYFNLNKLNKLYLENK